MLPSVCNGWKRTLRGGSRPPRSEPLYRNSRKAEALPRQPRSAAMLHEPTQPFR